MEKVNKGLIEYVIKENLSTQLFKGTFGLEKENVRVDRQGKLALTLHPKEFGDKLYNPYIKTDFSESQVEMVTPVCGSIEEVYAFLENLQDIISLNIGEEYLWPQSNPPIVPEEEEIPIAVFASEGSAEREYRQRLAEKYGRKKQLLSGIHYNFSFDEDFLMRLHREFGGKEKYRDFKDALYLKVAKNFLRYRWLLIYLTGASPAYHKSFGEKFAAMSEELDSESYYFKDMSSLRNSKCGYKNEEDFIVSYDSLEGYISAIQSLIDDGKIANANEFYNPVRLKAKGKKGNLEQLKNGGIQYLELRIFDLNPFNKNGIFMEDIYLTHLFMIYMVLLEETPFGAKEQDIANQNHDAVTVAGRQADLTIYDESGQLVSFRAAALDILQEMAKITRTFNVKEDFYATLIEGAREKVQDPTKTYAYRIIEEAKNKSYVAFHVEKAKEYVEDSRSNVILRGFEDLELSTQILIRDAITRGITFEILDREENFLKLQQGSQVEYVKQATKTSKDSYVTALIMENKVVTKELLKEHNLTVPTSSSYYDIEKAKLSFDTFQNSPIVVKPKSTNYGIGISIFKDKFTKKEYDRALEIAFHHDASVLIEHFVPGKEYRFLVIDNEVIGVLQRVPANVQGDGQRNIRELVIEKNKDPLRGQGHKTPLEKIVLGEIEESFLKAQGKDFDYLPRQGEVVFLRENSNISTGGDSIDYTELVHESYKELAVKAAQAIGAAITGVDIIIEDIESPCDESNYAIIELNFNPAMYMHYYPYQGKRRPVGEKVLDLLFPK
ncbi:bifunctional glutamate--cysteine ligase GshA/glutathione synthetase GshB [Heliorestis convoluta]|uniref:Glutathione biosynthesis bifunctional protein GshAB n=1 Tax=Heliorestis convoluta TaxID=356322 RepID=A0A5Q2N2M0_9FIRM|nr:bifunctional glutamate--cysteine ligase GshA/glutathione synthetase GshB [Heliorestis convoluta]QGG46815.1 glutathione biosynthesis bifunctional protein GshAB [Heliorestis convoluta]